MWKSIKKFFKWIADHTGISWIARKISSCWKPGNQTDQASSASQPRSQVPSESQDNSTVISERANSPAALEEQDTSDQTHSNSANNQADVTRPQKSELEPVINSISGDKDKLTLSLNNIDILYNKFNRTDPAELKCVYVECDKGVFKIILHEFLGLEDNRASFSIKSVERQGNKTCWSKLEEGSAQFFGAKLSKMKIALGLNKNNPIVRITQISKDQITVPKSEIASSATTPATSNDLSVNA